VKILRALSGKYKLYNVLNNSENCENCSFTHSKVFKNSQFIELKASLKFKIFWVVKNLFCCMEILDLYFSEWTKEIIGK
jgi:hypothetical protein